MVWPFLKVRGYLLDNLCLKRHIASSMFSSPLVDEFDPKHSWRWFCFSLPSVTNDTLLSGSSEEDLSGNRKIRALTHRVYSDIIRSELQVMFQKLYVLASLSSSIRPFMEKQFIQKSLQCHISLCFHINWVCSFYIKKLSNRYRSLSLSFKRLGSVRFKKMFMQEVSYA